MQQLKAYTGLGPLQYDGLRLDALNLTAEPTQVFVDFNENTILHRSEARFENFYSIETTAVDSENPTRGLTGDFCSPLLNRKRGVEREGMRL